LAERLSPAGNPYIRVLIHDTPESVSRRVDQKPGAAVRRDPLAAVTLATTPQTKPIPGTTQVRNAAGGYVFTKDLWNQVEDFLILGTTGGTYYTDATTLTEANVDILFEAIAADGPRVVALVTEIAIAQPARAPKPRPYLFALAACGAKGDPATRQAVKAAFSQVVRTTDHLAAFFGYWKNLAGKPSPGGTAPVIGRAMRTAFESWFNRDDVHDVALPALKARQRTTPAGEAMALRDVIRIAHVSGRTDAHRRLIGWLAGQVSDADARMALPDVDDFLTAQAVTVPAEAIAVIRERRVPWEFLPSAVMKDAAVWAELAGTVGMTALIRNLARMTRLGTLTSHSDATSRVVARLTSQQALAKARIHPMDVYLALKAYESGLSQPDVRKAAQTWEPVAAISDALEVAYELSFAAAEPTGRKYIVAVDSSGSMSSRWAEVVTAGSRLGTAYEVANTLAVMLARLEGHNVHVIDVDTRVRRSRVTPRTNLRELAGWKASGGGTDLSLPFSWAAQQRVTVDGFVVLTDNETWAGDRHPVQALDAYRRSFNPAARVIVVGMTATGYSIGDPGDPGVLNVAGLDSAMPKLIAGFLRT
jgi:60 kDa SS-A/Ro ribonucleoprotein